ncbi:MAG: two-component regulator propeller domain-containing protein [Chitinophagaceae bacterium]
MKSLCLAFVLILSLWSNAQPGPLGSWREHLPYGSAIDLASIGSRIMVATPYALFSYDPATQEIERWSRVNGLAETGIRAIEASADGSSLLIAYTNNNLDLLTENDILNIPDIRRDAAGQQALIHEIYPRGSNYYLSTDLGIIVVDAQAQVIRDTWRLGPGGTGITVTALTATSTHWLAATTSGLLQAPLSGINLADYRNWQQLSGSNGLPAGPCTSVVRLNDQSLVLSGNRIYQEQQGQWNSFYQPTATIEFMQVSNTLLTVAERDAGNQVFITTINATGTVVSRLQHPALLRVPRRMIWQHTEAWIADSLQGLIHYENGNFSPVIPNSPLTVATGQLLYTPSGFFTATGGVTAAAAVPAARPGSYSRLVAGEWSNQTASSLPALDSLPDIQSLAWSKTGNTLYAGSYGGGIVAVDDNNRVIVFKQGYLEADRSNPAQYRVAGMAIDQNQDLWISNAGAGNPLVLQQKDGQWSRFQPPFILTGNSFGNITIDNNNFKWIVPLSDPGLVCYNSGSSAATAADDQWLWLRAGTNGLPDDKVYCATTDRQGFIWIGTANGIGLLTCAADLFTARGCTMIRPIVAAGSTGAYLFQGERVQCIAVDGADRKWVGTTNGVWLLNAAADTVINRFTAATSPLPGNDVKNINIDPQTGEVFFQTTNGLASYRGTATEGGRRNNQVIVFPNPVPHGYNGQIAIRGLVENAFVKITELNGRLLYQTRALGGQAIWNGRDARGNAVATGVYLVLATDHTGKESVATRIVVVK